MSGTNLWKSGSSKIIVKLILFLFTKQVISSLRISVFLSTCGHRKTYAYQSEIRECEENEVAKNLNEYCVK